MAKIFFVKLLSSIILTLSLSVVFAQEQAKFAAVKDGLSIRNEPSIEGEIIDVIPFNSQVYLTDHLQLDTIEYRIAHWHRVSVDTSGRIGYVFGGYLNNQKLPTKEFSSLRILIWEIIENLEVDYEIEYLADSSGKFNENIRIQGGKKHLLIHKFGYEWKNIELNLYDWELYEIINLIELGTWFGQKQEYQIFKDAHQEGNFYRFKWINGFDDPEGTMILESRYPKGIRIIESSSL